MAFRDSFEACPRCATTLEDAGSARGCRTCGGAFVDEPVLAEMILEMLPPPPRVFGTLALSEIQRSGNALACPSCGDGMKMTRLHDVDLDHCPKHGVWFDAEELRILLYRAADPDNPPPFKEWSPVEPDVRAPSPRPVPARSPPLHGVTFRAGGNEIVRPETVIKIGRMATAHVRVDDPDVARMHAVIEVDRDAMTIIDLGSAAGTFVNGQRVTKATLRVGDVIRVGSTPIEVVSR